MPGLFQSIFMPHSTPKAPKMSEAPAPAAPSAKSTVTGAAVAPGTDPTAFKQDQNAFWNQFAAATGQTSPETQAGIQSNIDKQASLIG